MNATIERLTSALADRYRVERELGAGGMATVYLAHDLRHERDVAIKVLHPDLGAVLGGERFLAEIKTTARLQHPHILPLLDSGVADGLLYYVMPFVKGETLRAKLTRETQLALPEAVRITTEIADALEHAHAQGVIHRDIKPENILLQDGHALVADFGIALAVQQAGGQRMTQTGLSLGTPQYMSPEQASGEKSVDARSDIYALAAVAYEMLTGNPPFTGSNVQAIIARVLASDPEPPSRVRKTIPAPVEAAVLQGLAKLPADRFASAKEFATALRGESTSGGVRVPSAHAAVRRGWSLWLPWAATAVASAAALFFAVTKRSQTSGDVGVSSVAVSVELPEGVTTDNVGLPLAVSADGQTIVVAGSGSDFTRRLYRRGLRDAVVVALAGTEEATFPTFSPDGKSVAFVAKGHLRKVPLDGGAVKDIADVGEVYGVAWSTNGSLIVSANGQLVSVDENGGPLRPMSDASPTDKRNDRFPMLLPDGKSLLYATWSGGIASARVMKRPISSGASISIALDSVVPIAALQNGLIVAMAGGAVGFVPTNADYSHAEGQPRKLMDGISNWITVAHVAVSPTGTLVYQPGTAIADLTLVDPVTGREEIVSPERREFNDARVSPDGRRIASYAYVGLRAEITITDLANHSTTRLLNPGIRNGRPEWSPDGTRVLSRGQLPDGNSRIEIRKADGSDSPVMLQPNGWEAMYSPDGKTLLYRVGTASTADIYWRNIEGDTTSHAFLTSPGTDQDARFSPDGSRVAWDSDASGVQQVFLARFPAADERLQISDNGGEQPVWSRDGRAVYYVASRGRLLIRATLESAGGGLRVARRDTVVRSGSHFTHQDGHATYDVAPDGRLVLVRRDPPGRFPIIITNWWPAAGQPAKRVAQP